MVQDELLHDGIDELCTMEASVVPPELHAAELSGPYQRTSLCDALDRRLAAVIKALDH